MGLELNNDTIITKETHYSAFVFIRRHFTNQLILESGFVLPEHLRSYAAEYK